MAKTAQKEANKRDTAVLYAGIELSGGTWRFAFRDGATDRTREASVAARDLVRIKEAFERAKRKLGLAENAVIRSCYEAGRDGFWLHRWLIDQGVENLVLDAASLQVDRRLRRKKTDRLDARSLVAARQRLERGESEAARVCRVPTPEEEDLRREPRERERLKREEKAHRARISSLLALHGADPEVRPDAADFEKVAGALGSPLPQRVRAELQREQDRLLLVIEQRQHLDKGRRARLQHRLQNQQQAKAGATDTGNAEERTLDKTLTLMTLKGMGVTSSWDLCHEYLFRNFRSAKEVGSGAGLTGSPYNTGATVREQGISKAGNKRVRALMVEVAWMWLRYQPDSKLTRWFHERFGAGKRMRRVGIVALARRLLVALWRYLEFGVVPDGAILRDAAKAI